MIVGAKYSCQNIFVEALRRQFYKLLRENKMFFGNRKEKWLRDEDQFSVNGLMCDVYHKITGEGSWDRFYFRYMSDYGPQLASTSCPHPVFLLFSKRADPKIQEFLFRCENYTREVCVDFFDKIEEFKPKKSIILLPHQTPLVEKNYQVIATKVMKGGGSQTTIKYYTAVNSFMADKAFKEDSGNEGYKILKTKETVF